MGVDVNLGRGLLQYAGRLVARSGEPSVEDRVGGDDVLQRKHRVPALFRLATAEKQHGVMGGWSLLGDVSDVSDVFNVSDDPNG